MEFYTDVQKSKNDLLVRGYRNGVRFEEKVNYKPTLYVPAPGQKTKKTDILGNPLEPIQFETMTAANDFLFKYRGMSDFPIFGMTRYAYPYINETFPGEVQYDTKTVKVGIIDIEVGSDDGFPDPKIARKEVTAITLYCRGKYIVFTWGFEYKPHRPDILHIHSPNEKRLLEKFLDVWERLDLDIVSGWNCEGFDVPYMVNRITKILGTKEVKRLSPWGQIRAREGQNKFGQTITYYQFVGMHVVDYLAVYMKHAYIGHENYKLDTVAYDDLGAQKTDYSEYHNLHTFYIQNHQKFVEYNVRDVELINLLDEKHQLMSFVISYAYDAKITFSDVFGSVLLWDTIIHTELAKDNIIVDPSVDEVEEESFIGAYVKPPVPGMHHYTVSYDMTSLYPSLAVQNNISPETFVEQLLPSYFDGNFINEDNGRVQITAKDVVDGFWEHNKELADRMKRENLVLTSNGCLWDRSKQGVLGRIIKRIMNERKEYKAKMNEARSMFEKTKDPKYEYDIARYKILQHVRKIQLNSLYGCLGNKYFRWYRMVAAEAITTHGQLAIQWTEYWINNKLNQMMPGLNNDYIVAMDTDSVYLTMGAFVNKKLSPREGCEFAHQLTEDHVAPTIDSCLVELNNMFNGYEPFLTMKKESISNRAIWTAKKRYVLNAYYEEGVWYDDPKMKITGMEAIKTSTPYVCREKIKEGLKIIMSKTQEDFYKFINDFYEEFTQLPFEKIAFPRGVNGIIKYDPGNINSFIKGTPFHTRGALVYNHAIKKQKLTDKYQPIRDGDKIIFGYLQTPNPLHSNAISVPDVLPKELGLSAYVDYEKMFQKAFLEPFERIGAAVDWKLHERISVVDELFDIEFIDTPRSIMNVQTKTV